MHTTNIFSRFTSYFKATLFALASLVVFFALANFVKADITNITVTSPNGGEFVGGTVNITWQCQDDGNSPDCANTTITDILYSPDGGSAWESVGYTGGSLYANAGSFSWDTTSNTESNNGLIRIVTNNAGKNDESDAPFTIDNTRPQINSAETRDEDKDGWLDHVIVNIDDFGGSGVVSCDPSGWTIDSNPVKSCQVVSKNVLKLEIDDPLKTTYRTNAQPAVEYNDATGNTTDQAGNELKSGNATPADGAAPVPVYASIIDHDGDGKLDLVSVRFSEPFPAKIGNGATGATDSFTVSSAGDFNITSSNDGVMTDGNKNGNADSNDLEVVSFLFTTDTIKTDIGDLKLKFGSTDGQPVSGTNLTDLTGNEALGFTIDANGITGVNTGITLEDEASPVAKSVEYFNDTSSATPWNVDRFRIIFSEPVYDSSVSNLSGFLSQMSITANDLTGFAGPVNTMTIQGGGDIDPWFAVDNPSNQITGIQPGQTQPTFQFNGAPGNTLTDADGNEWNAMSTALSMVDKAKPVAIDLWTMDDVSVDGNVDTLEIKFSEPIDDNTFSASDWVLNDIGVGSGSDTFTNFHTDVSFLAADADPNDEYVRLTLSPTNTKGTAAKEIDYNPGSVADLQGNTLEAISGHVAEDKAAPQVQVIEYLDQDGNGKIDGIKLITSENLANSSNVSGQDLTVVNVGDFTDFDFVSTHSTNLVSSGTNEVVVDAASGAVTESSVFDTRDDSGTFQIEEASGGSFLLEDTNGNSSAFIDNGVVTYVDKAAPVLLTAHADTRTEGDGNGNTQTMTLKYTEDVSANSSTNTSDYTVKVNSTSNQIAVSSVNLSGDEIILNLDTNDPNQTTAQLNVSYAQGTVKDWKNNEAAAQNETAVADKANPVLVGFTVNPQDPVKIGDDLSFELGFSEPMNTAVNLTGTVFADGTNTFNVNNTGYTIKIWSGDYANNPVDPGNPPSGQYTFMANWIAEDPAGNQMLTPNINLNFVIDSGWPITNSVDVTNNAHVGDPIVITAQATDDYTGIDSAEYHIYDASGNPVRSGNMSAADGAFGDTSEALTATVNTNGLSAGTYTVYVTSTDAAGNAESEDDINGVNADTFTLLPGQDTTPPTISNINVSTTQTTATITWDTNEPATSEVEWGADASYGHKSAADSTADKTNHSVTISTGLVCDTVYHFRVISRDASGNESTSSDATFRTDVCSPQDTTAPNLNSTAPSTEQTVGSVQDVVFIFSDNAGFSATAADNIVSFVMDGNDIKSSTKTTAQLDQTHHTLTVTYSDQNLPVGVHNFNITVKDAAGNEKDASLTVVVKDPADTQAPNITSIQVVGITSNAATVNFTSNEDGFARVYYGTTNSYGNVTAWQTISKNTLNSIDLGGLSCNTPYHFKIEAKDASGNTKQTADSTFNTGACADNTAPQVVSTNPVTGATGISVNADKVTVKFNENIQIVDQNAITIEKVGGASVKNGSATVNSDTLEIPYTALDYGTTYKVTVPASSVADTAGNNPVADTVIYFTTQTANAPGINILYASDVDADSATIHWGTDVQPDTVEYRISTTPYSGLWNSIGTVNNNSGTFTINNLQSGVTFYYQVRFTKNGQTTVSVPMSFTTAASNTGITVDSIQAVKTYAAADDTYANGWKWIFNITVNNLSETNLAMKFAQWVSGTNTIDAANNMRYSIDNTNWTNITANGSYGANVDISSIDLDSTRGGRQVRVYVEMKVPVGTQGGSYSTQYGIKTQ